MNLNPPMNGAGHRAASVTSFPPGSRRITVTRGRSGLAIQHAPIRQEQARCLTTNIASRGLILRPKGVDCTFDGPVAIDMGELSPEACLAGDRRVMWVHQAFSVSISAALPSAASRPTQPTSSL
jgi:hypothetical protein